MPNNPPRRARRPWKVMVGILVVVFLLFLLFGMLSEREDAEVLPPAEMEGMEQVEP